MSTYRRCEGRRRMRRGRVLGTFACTKKAVYVVETRVGMTRLRYACAEDDCIEHLRGGYPAEVRALKA